jgi:DNA-binding response OmpR family regulator
VLVGEDERTLAQVLESALQEEHKEVVVQRPGKRKRKTT